jgi:hypothetical protein
VAGKESKPEAGGRAEGSVDWLNDLSDRLDRVIRQIAETEREVREELTHARLAGRPEHRRVTSPQRRRRKKRQHTEP